jgi:hypothetical protein
MGRFCVPAITRSAEYKIASKINDLRVRGIDDAS